MNKLILFFMLWTSVVFAQPMQINDELQFTEDCYFEGNVGIGTTTPEAKLHVSISDTLGNAIAHLENNIDNAIITVHTHSDSSVLYGLQTEDFNSALGLLGTTGEVILLTGLGVEAITIDTNNNVTIPDLAGSGTRLVTTDSTGELGVSTQPLMYYVAVELDSTQITESANTPITIIAAPAFTESISIINVAFYYNIGLGGDFITSADIGLTHGCSNNIEYLFNFLTSQSSAASGNIAVTDLADCGMEGMSFDFRSVNAVSGGGGAGCFLRIYITYMIIPSDF